MPRLEKSCPLPREQVIDRYFLEHRAKIIDVAAFLDRVDRAAPTSESAEDFRMVAFQRALMILSDGRGERARRVLDLLSDHAEELPQDAGGTKGAVGASPEVLS